MEISVAEILKKAVKNQINGISFVLATVVEGAEKTPGKSGFKLISYADGTSEGTVGGGKLERLVLQKCEEIFQTKKNVLLTFNLTEKGIGMACGGNVKVYCEYFAAKRKIYIFGAGHLCKSLVPLLKTIGFYCIVIDNREDFAKKKNIPIADEVIFGDYLKFLKNMKIEENDAIVIFTHGHLYDFEILNKICEQEMNAKYFGMIGSKVKVAKMITEIKQKKYNGNLIEKLHSPIGLNIATGTTQEISIAITAEILSVYNEVKKIKSLKL